MSRQVLEMTPAATHDAVVANGRLAYACRGWRQQETSRRRIEEEQRQRAEHDWWEKLLAERRVREDERARIEAKRQLIAHIHSIARMLIVTHIEHDEAEIPDNGFFLYLRAEVESKIDEDIEDGLGEVLNDDLLTHWFETARVDYGAKVLERKLDGDEEQEWLWKHPRGGQKAMEAARESRHYHCHDHAAHQSWKAGTHYRKNWGRHQPEHCRR